MHTPSIRTGPRRRLSFDEDWSFRLTDIPEASAPQFDDSGWRMLDLPHDWSIECDYHPDNPTGKFGAYLPGGIGWYRKTFLLTPELQDKRLYLEFEGVYMNSDVYINGHHLGRRPYGYLGFEYDLTPYLVPDRNVISVRVDNSLSPSSRWYTGAGIYRHTWLTVTEDVHVAHWGTYITTPQVDERHAAVSVRTEIVNRSDRARSLTLVSRFLNPEGLGVAEASSEFTVEAGTVLPVQQSVTVTNPALWSPEHPDLYSLQSEIRENGHRIDDYITTFGIRYFEFSAEAGFKLNGVSMLLQGVCLHDDGGPVGAAVPEKLWEKRLRMLKEMGCNAVRTSHNPFEPAFYDLCDAIGLMVIDEAFDGWNTPKIPYDYSLYFDEWWEKDLGDMIRRDRNHPSIMMWSIGNEIREQKVETTVMLQDFVHRLEPTRPVTCGINFVGEAMDENRGVLDIAGYNDGGGACFVYESDHLNYPDRVMLATEAPHTLHTRGFYRTQTWWRDKDQPRIEIPNLTEEEIFTNASIHYSSSYDNCGVRASARHSWDFVKKYPYLVGEFRWTGFDYLGETRQYPARSNSAGVIDLANFPKDHYYFYQSQFTTKPMVHLLPHWTHPGMEGKVIPVWVYTNCEEAELIVNGCSLGRKPMGEDMYISWDVGYVPGSIEAIAYRDGHAAARKRFETAGRPAAIKLSTDTTDLNTDGRDLAQVSFEIVDSKGRLVPYGDNTVHLTSTGPVEFLGSENGDIIDVTPAKSPSRAAFFGLGMGLYRSTLESGDIEITAAAIVGERIFLNETTVSISVDSIALRGALSAKSYDIYYTTDGTKPTAASAVYEGSLHIDESCTVRAVVVDRDRVVFELETTFVKGEQAAAVDTSHGNRREYIPPFRDRPQSPKVCGVWLGNGTRFLLMNNGDVFLFQGSPKAELAGTWWYELSEGSEDAGRGEIRWADGTVQPLALESGEGRRLLMLSQNSEPIHLARWKGDITR
jgi:beta-galactosidase